MGDEVQIDSLCLGELIPVFKPGGGGRDGMDAHKLTHMIVDGGILSEIMWAEEGFLR